MKSHWTGLLLACAVCLPLAAQAGVGRSPGRPHSRALHHRLLHPQAGPRSLACLARNPAVRKHLGLTDAQVAQQQLARLQLRRLRQTAQPGGMPDEAAIDNQLATALRHRPQRALEYFRLC